jgi:hypothetical protein
VADPARLKRFAKSERAKGMYISAADEWSRLEAGLEQLQMQLSDLRQLPTPNQSAIGALQTKVTQIENRLAYLYRKFTETQLAIAEQQYTAARQKQEQIAGYFEAQRQEALQLNKQLTEYTILQSEWEQTKKLCDILDERIKEINITEDTGSLNISVLETARPADKPSKPPKARYMAISLLFGLVLAGGLALVRVGARVLGVVVNDVPENGRFGYYGGERYYNSGNGAFDNIAFHGESGVTFDRAAVNCGFRLARKEMLAHHSRSLQAEYLRAAAVLFGQFDKESESDFVIRPQDICAQTATGLLDRPGFGGNAEGLVKTFHARAGNHLGMGR